MQRTFGSNWSASLARSTSLGAPTIAHQQLRRRFPRLTTAGDRRVFEIVARLRF